MKQFKYTIDGKEYQVEICDINPESLTADIKVNGEAYKVGLEKEAEPEKKKVILGKPEAPSANEDNQVTSSAGVNTNNALKAPLPGVITDVKVVVGDQVKAGDTIVVLEAMKMANNIEAEHDGVIKAVLVKTGESVLEDTPLAVIE